MPLADDVIVYPGHGAGSACGKKMSKDTWGFLGNQKVVNYAEMDGTGGKGAPRLKDLVLQQVSAICP